VSVAPRELLYIGKGVRDKVLRIKRKITYNDLTATAKDELLNVLDIIVTQQEKKFVNFFNTAGALTTRMHSLELLPGIGKKHLWIILEERRVKPFESFEDIRLRAKISDPKKLIIKRIISELIGEDKYRLFVKG
jgi:putative nucleotide binding protein